MITSASNPFFDLGAWHGHLLPDGPATMGSFPGPPCSPRSTSTLWRPIFDRLTVYQNGKSRLHPAGLEPAGALAQTLSAPGVRVEMTLRCQRPHPLLETKITSSGPLAGLGRRAAGEALRQRGETAVNANHRPGFPGLSAPPERDPRRSDRQLRQSPLSIGFNDLRRIAV